MTYQIIDNFAAGLDTRKSPLTSPAGTLTRLVNAVITPGGEIAKRRAFTLAATVTGTFGMAATESSLFVFGKNADPVLPAWSIPGTILRGAKIPNTSAGLKQMDFDVFDGYIYLSCITDITTTAALRNPHYYLGIRTGTGVGVVPAVYDGVETEGSGKGYYVRTFKSKVYAVLGKYLYFSAVGNPMVWDSEALNDAVVVTKVAAKSNPLALTVSTAEINQFTVGHAVYVTGIVNSGMVLGNGFHYVAAVNAGSGIFTLTGVNGASSTTDQTTGVVATPATRVSQISNTNPAVCTVDPADIGKFVDGMKVRINGIVGGIVPPPTAANPNSNQFIIDSVGNPVNTFKLVGLNASGFTAPQTTDTWATLTTDVLRVGMGWINPSLTDAASESLKSLEVYYDRLAIFSTQATQIWAIAANPNDNAFDQLLRGAGTTAPRSPLQYGSGDVLYLDPSGIRSLKAKDSSNSASVSDIGSPVDPYVRDLKALKGQPFLDGAVALLEPSVGRFWMVFEDRVLVLSYFPGPKITAWSVFMLTELAGSKVTYAATCGGKVFLRDSNDRIWVYGGPLGTSYNNPVVEVRLPYLDSKKPGHKKMFQAFDATVKGNWDVAVSYDYNNPDQEEIIANISQPTWNMGQHEMQGYDSHFSLRFYNNTDEEAEISNCAVHYSIADDEA